MIPAVLKSFSLTFDYLRRLVADVSDQQMTAQPGGAVNHPAWVMGHLVYSCQGIAEVLGVKPWLPEQWLAPFITGSVPDTDRQAYPSKAELLQALDDGQRKVSEALAAMDEQELREPLPDEDIRSLFPTLGHAVVHILGAHAAVHVGQVSVWRRAIGLAPLAEPFP